MLYFIFLICLPWFLDTISCAAIFITRLFSQDDSVPEKKPSHIAFVFTNETEISVEILSEFVSQCAQHQLTQVSFYDPFARCISHYDQLYKSVKYTWDHLRKTDLTAALPAVVFDRTSKQLIDRAISGMISEDLRVSLLAHADSRSCLVDVCKEIVADRLIPCESIAASTIASLLNERHLSEPDLTIVVGTTSTLAGFSPWSLRVTELFPVATLTPMSADMFNIFLHAFARRDRRLGR